MATTLSSNIPAELESTGPCRLRLAGSTTVGRVGHGERCQRVVPFQEQRMGLSGCGRTFLVPRWAGWRPGWHQFLPHLVLPPLRLHEAYVLRPVDRSPTAHFLGARVFQVLA